MRYKYLLINLILFFSISLFAKTDLEKVSIQLQWLDQFQFAGYYIAKEKGFYEDEGLDVEIKKFGYGINSIDEVENKKATYGIGRSSLIIDKSNGKNIKILSPIFQASPLVLLSIKNQNINSIEDFVGKRMMVTSAASSTVSLHAMISQKGIKVKDIIQQKHSFNLDDLISNKTDLMASYISNEPFILEQKGIEYDVFDPKDYGFDFYGDILFTSDDEVNNHRQRTRNFTKATLKAWEYAFNNIEETVELILKKYNSQNKSKEALLFEANALKKLAYYQTKHLGNINPYKIQRIYDIYNVMGFIKNKIDIDELILNDDKNKKFEFTKEELSFIKQKKSIKIAMMNNFKPFSFIEKNKHQGLSVDILKRISDVSGLNFDIETSTWSNSLKKFKDKKVDIISGISYTEKREKFSLFSKPFYEIPTYIFGNKNDKHYNSIDDLKNKRVGVSKDMFYINTLKDIGVKVKEYKNSKEKAKALAFGYIDYFLANYTTGQNAINSQALTNIKALDEFEDIKKEDLRYGILKNNKILQSIIEKSLKQVDDSEFTYLINKWIMNLEKKTTPTPEETLLLISKKQQEYLDHKKEITICADPDWLPFEEIINGKLKGISLDYKKIFEDKLGVPFRLIPTSTWSMSLEFAKQRKCDILSFLAMKTEKRKQHFNFTTPYVKVPLVLATKLDVTFVTNFNTLRNHKIGIQKGYAFVEILKKKYPTLNIVEVNNIKDGLEQVKDGKIFGYIGTLASVGHMFQTYFTGELKIAGKFDEIWELGVAVRNDDFELLALLQRVVNSISENKQQEILNKHIAIKYEKRIDYSLIWEIAIVSLLILAGTIYWNRRLSLLNKELKKTKKEVENSLDDFEYLFNNTIEAIALFQNNICIDINEAGIKLFGADNKSKVIGRNALDFVAPEFLDQVKNKLSSSFTELYEIDIVRIDGIAFPALVKGYNTTLQGKVTRVTSLIDLTKLKEKENELIKAKDKAQNATKVKSNFLSNMSHEIRTPMNAVIGMIHLMQETKLDKQQEDYIFKIQSASNSLLRIINDILDFSKIEVGKLTLNKENFNLKNILNEIENIVSVNVNEKNLYFKINYEDDISMNFYGDSLRVNQILINLVSNAIKFTNEGSVEVSIEKKQHNIFRFCIADTGIGLNPQEINKLFNSFTQADDSITRKFGGTGLGLAICKQLVELMNGKIWIESKVGIGSEFIFDIELEPSNTTIKINEIKIKKELDIKMDDNLKKEVSEEIINELFDDLYTAVKRRRPNLCEPIVKELNNYKLKEKDKKFFYKIKTLIKQYKFNEVGKLIDER